MSDLVFYIFIILFAIVTYNTERWFILDCLNVRALCPLLYLNNPKLYGVARVILFIALLIAIGFLNSTPWYFALLILFLSVFIPTILGRKKGVNIAREMFRDLADGSGSEEDINAQETLGKSDKEFFDTLTLWQHKNIKIPW